MVIEAVDFASAGFGGAGQPDSSGDAGRSWLAGLAGGAVHEDVVGAASDGPVLGWIGPRPFTEAEAGRLRDAARFAAAPLASTFVARDADCGARGLSRPAQRRACAGRTAAA